MSRHIRISACTCAHEPFSNKTAIWWGYIVHNSTHKRAHLFIKDSRHQRCDTNCVNVLIVGRTLRRSCCGTCSACILRSHPTDHSHRETSPPERRSRKHRRAAATIPRSSNAHDTYSTFTSCTWCSAASIWLLMAAKKGFDNRPDRATLTHWP